MDNLEWLLGIPSWLGDVLWPVAKTVLPWMVEHPISFIPVFLVFGFLEFLGLSLKGRDGALRELGLSTAVKWVAIIVALVYIKRNWPLVSGWLKKATLVILACAWVLVMWKVPRVRWSLFATAWIAGAYPLVRWAEWTGGRWISRDAYYEAKERDQWMHGIRLGVGALYPGSNPKIQAGMDGDPFGFTVAFLPGIGQAVEQLDRDAQSGATGNAIYRMGKRYGLPHAPKAVRVLPGDDQGHARLRIDTHGLGSFEDEIRLPPLLMKTEGER
jgi:hypothetical protein